MTVVSLDTHRAANADAYADAARVLVKESGVTLRKTRRSMSGLAYTHSADWGIEAPDPRGAISFGVFAHEVAHQLLHRHSGVPRWQQEIEAEDYALAQFDRFNLPGRDRYMHKAAQHLAYSFAKAIRRSPRLADVIAATYPAWWERAATYPAWWERAT